MRKAARFLTIALLLVTGCLGLSNGVRELGDSATALQMSVTVAVLIYGVLGIAGAIGLMRRSRWAPAVIAGWALASAWAGTVASFAYHDPGFENPGTIVGASTALVGILLVGAFMVWTARVSTGPAAPQREPAAASRVD